MAPDSLPWTARGEKARELGGREPNARIPTRSKHQPAPLGAMGLAAPTEDFVDGGMRELVTDDLLEQLGRGGDEEARDPDLPSARDVASE